MIIRVLSTCYDHELSPLINTYVHFSVLGDIVCRRHNGEIIHLYKGTMFVVKKSSKHGKDND